MGAKRRLLVVTESVGVGGTESHLLRLLPCLLASGWEVTTFCLSGRGERADELESKGIEVLSRRHSLGAEKFDRRHPAFIARAANSLFWFERRWRPHIAHFYLPGPYVVGAPIAIANGTPLKIMSRRSLSNYQQNWPMVARIERILHQRIDALIGNSRAVVAQLIAEGAHKDRVRLIYNGIQTSEPLSRAMARQKLGFDEKELVGSVVANLIHYKGHQDLIMGLGQVARHLPSNWQILFVGRDQGLQAKLEKLATAEGVADHVQFLGQRADVPELLAAADFGLLTSHEEGFSNVILESMSAGLPMIVTAVGGNPEAVVKDETGLLVAAHDPSAIGEAVLQLAGDAELRKRFGTAGRQRVSREFSLEKCVAAHSELYEELLYKAKLNRIYAGARPPPRELSKRPLMLAYWGRYGALPQLTLELAEACQRVGDHEQTTISISTSNELFHRYLALGEAIFPIVTYPKAVSAANFGAALKLRSALKQRLHEDGTRAFVTLMPHVWSPFITPVLKQAGIRHTVIVHDAEPHRGDSTALINRWLMQEAKSADQVVTLTAAVAERLIERNVIPQEKIAVLFHPDLTYASPERRNDAPLRVLFFGRILPYKGLSLFVGAMELLKHAGLPIEIGVFGKGDLGRERERLEALGAEVVNRWLEPHQIATILKRHDVVVVSHTEASQSGVIAAAHGAGLPVVTTPVGGLSEQVGHEITGLVAAETTSEAIASAVRRLSEDRKLLVRLRGNIAATRYERSMERFICELRKIALSSEVRSCVGI